MLEKVNVDLQKSWRHQNNLSAQPGNSVTSPHLEALRPPQPLHWRLNQPENLVPTKSNKEQKWTVCTGQTYMCAYQEHGCVCVCVYIYVIYIKKKLDQSINYLVNRRKCLIITWSPSMHNVCKKKMCNAFLFCLWVKLLKVKSNKFSVTVQRRQFHVLLLRFVSWWPLENSALRIS